jgi:hypothetical protein
MPASRQNCGAVIWDPIAAVLALSDEFSNRGALLVGPRGLANEAKYALAAGQGMFDRELLLRLTARYGHDAVNALQKLLNS